MKAKLVVRFVHVKCLHNFCQVSASVGIFKLRIRMDDWELLQRYLAGNSEDAFAQLVTRHLGLVYATALRRLNGDAHLAQDVAQLVFTNLARKAHQLTPAVVLAGWLHRDTCFTTLEVLRKERRRHAREQAACLMNSNGSASLADSERIHSCLDEALNQLSPADRDALLLRFFEQRSLQEIGQRLGFGESGASRRVTRALEKLRALLARKGLATTSASLAALLGSLPVQAAPPGLAATLSAASLSAAASSTATSGIIAMASLKTKITLAAVAGLALLAPIGFHLHYRSHQEHQATAEQTRDLRDLEREHLQQAAQQMIPLIIYASEHDNQLPASLAAVGLDDEQYELVFKGPFPTDRETLARTVVLRQKLAWQKPNGNWMRVHAYADGHSQAWPAEEEGE